jgi:hypothetical protein
VSLWEDAGTPQANAAYEFGLASSRSSSLALRARSICSLRKRYVDGCDSDDNLDDTSSVQEGDEMIPRKTKGA